MSFIWVRRGESHFAPHCGAFLYMAINQELYDGQVKNIRNDQLITTQQTPRLTSQEQMLVAATNAGASITEAARRCGLSPLMAKRALEREDVQQSLHHYQEEFARDILPRVKFDRDDAHHMYMTAYRGSANATEQIKATDSLVKLHRLNEPEKKAEEKEINTSKQFEGMSVNQLLKLAGYKLTGLNPEDIEDVEDAEVPD